MKEFFSAKDFDYCDAPLFKNRKLATDRANAKVAPLLVQLKDIDHKCRTLEREKMILEAKVKEQGELLEEAHKMFWGWRAPWMPHINEWLSKFEALKKDEL